MRNLILTCITLTLVATMTTGCRDKKTTDTEGGVGSELIGLTDEYGNTINPGEDFTVTRTRVPGVNLSPVYFGFDSYQLPGGEMAKIDSAVRHLQSNSRHVCVVEGHCDDRGSNEYNLSLGEQRALTVRTYMINAGVAENRIQTKSFGEEMPAVSGSGEAVWSKNRRGEFAIYQ